MGEGKEGEGCCEGFFKLWEMWERNLRFRVLFTQTDATKKRQNMNQKKERLTSRCENGY